MLNQENPIQLGAQTTTNKKSRKKIGALLTGIIAIAVIFTALLIPPSLGSSIQLNLNYKVGEKMTYETTNLVTNQMVNTSINIVAQANSHSYNSTSTLEVLSFDGQNYSINQTITGTIQGQTLTIPLMINKSKTDYYNNFIAPGAPLVFHNSSGNPSISAYLAQQTVNVGDVWKIPVNTGNTSLGLTGEITLKFTGLQEITVPGGTFKTFSIEVSSNKLSVHADDSSIIRIPNGMTTQLNGTTYLEQGTCRLIKSDLTQETVTNSPGTGSTSTIYTEKTLVEYAKP